MKDIKERKNTVDYLVQKYIETKEEKYFDELWNTHKKLFFTLFAKYSKSWIMASRTCYKCNIEVDRAEIVGLAVTKAIKTFTLDKNIKFSTYLGTIMRNDINMNMRNIAALKNSDLSLENQFTTAHDSKNPEKEHLEDWLEDTNQKPLDYNLMTDCQTQEYQLLLTTLLRILSPSEKRLFEHITSGIGQVQLAEELGISQAQVSRTYIKIRKKTEETAKRLNIDLPKYTKRPRNYYPAIQKPKNGKYPYKFLKEKLTEDLLESCELSNKEKEILAIFLKNNKVLTHTCAELKRDTLVVRTILEKIADTKINAK